MNQPLVKRKNEPPCSCLVLQENTKIPVRHETKHKALTLWWKREEQGYMMHCMQRAPTSYAMPPCAYTKHSRSASLPVPSPAHPRPCMYVCAYDISKKDTAVLVARRADWIFCMAERSQRCKYTCITLLRVHLPM